MQHDMCEHVRGGEEKRGGGTTAQNPHQRPTPSPNHTRPKTARDSNIFEYTTVLADAFPFMLLQKSAYNNIGHELVVILTIAFITGRLICIWCVLF